MKALAALALFLVAAGPKPYPAQQEGSGSERTAGTGVFASTTFVPRSALVAYEIGESCCPQRTIGRVSVYPFERAGVSCQTLAAAKARRFFSYTVDNNGRRLPVGRPPPTSWFQQASFNVVGLTTGFQLGIRIVFTRIDTSPGARWHGTITVTRVSFSGKAYSLAAGFAARWCGTRTR